MAASSCRIELERGADGANTGYAYPEMLVQLVKLIKAGERAAAHDLFDRHLPLLRYEQQPGMLGLAVRKYILKRRGAIASDAQRKPGISFRSDRRDRIPDRAAGGHLEHVPASEDPRQVPWMRES